MDDTASVIDDRSNLPAWLIFGFLFWVAFLLVLEPGNVARAIAAGIQLTFETEAVRILGAAVIGGASTPIVVYFLHRYRIAESRALGRIVWFLFALIALAGVLNLVSSFAAAWALEHRWFPYPVEVRDQLIRNWALLTFVLITLAILAEAAPAIGLMPTTNPRHAGQGESRRLLVKSGRQVIQVDVDTIDWIEAQGNYVAIHAGTDTHLIRETLMRFEDRLDSSRFARVHRSVIVAVNRIERMQSTDSGGAVLQLRSGQELVASRRYRKQVRKTWVESCDSAVQA